MDWGGVFDPIWRRPPTREARNEQKKALASLCNALAVAMIVTGLVGPAINPGLAASLSLPDRAFLVLGGVLAHIVVRAILWSLEDK